MSNGLSLWRDVVHNKQCPCCKITKPPSQFYPSRCAPTRLSSYCKQCIAQKREVLRARIKRTPASELSIPREKKCPSCGLKKLISEFHRDAARPDKHNVYCKTCVAEQRRRGRKSRGPLREFLVGQRMRKRRLNAPGRHTNEQFVLRCEYYGWQCYLCGTSLTKDTATKDHRIPISRGGTHWPANLAPACRECNFSKNDRTETEYKRWLETI